MKEIEKLTWIRIERKMESHLRYNKFKIENFSIGGKSA